MSKFYRLLLISIFFNYSLSFVDTEDQLIQAAKDGNLELIKKLISNGVNVNYQNGQESTALHAAAQGGHAQVVQYLLENRANPQLLDEKQLHPVILAIKHDKADAVDLLYPGSNNVTKNIINNTCPLPRPLLNIISQYTFDSPDKKSLSETLEILLDHAFVNNSTNTIKLIGSILNSQKCSDILDRCLLNRVTLCAEYQHIPSLINTLLDPSINTNNLDNQFNAFYAAMQNDWQGIIPPRNLDKAKVLLNYLDKNRIINHLSFTQICQLSDQQVAKDYMVKMSAEQLSNLKIEEIKQIIEQNFYELVVILLPHLTQEKKNEILSITCIYQKLNIVKLLLENGADPNYFTKDGKTPLHIICENPTSNVYISHNNWINTHATEKDIFEIIEQLIKHNGDVNAKTIAKSSNRNYEEGCTSMHFLIGGAHEFNNFNLEIVDLLLKNGADINAKDKNGSLPTNYISSNHLDVIPLVVKKNAHITNPTRFLSMTTNVELAKFLIDLKADVNGSKNDILHDAANRGNTNLVKLLIESKADKTAKADYQFSKNVYPFELGDDKKLEILKLLMHQSLTTEHYTQVLKDAFNQYKSIDDMPLIDFALENNANPKKIDFTYDKNIFKLVQNPELIEKLIKHGANIEKDFTKNLRLPLIFYIINSADIEKIKASITPETDINFELTYYHRSLLSFVKHHNSLDRCTQTFEEQRTNIFEILLKNNIKITYQDLLDALYEFHQIPQALKLLLDYQALDKLEENLPQILNYKLWSDGPYPHKQFTHKYLNLLIDYGIDQYCDLFEKLENTENLGQEIKKLTHYRQYHKNKIKNLLHEFSKYPKPLANLIVDYLYSFTLHNRIRASNA